MRHGNLPFHFYVYVDNSFLGPNMPQGKTEAIWHGVYCRPGQTLMCHVLLETGAHWSGLPLHAISTTDDFSLSDKTLMPWSAMGDHIEVFEIKYMEGLECQVFKPEKHKGRHTGIMIDWADGFSRYPQEHKPLNLIELDSGQFALPPNNFVEFKDEHFVNDKLIAQRQFYKRNEIVYWGD